MERTVVRHHRRRLARAGWLDALDAGGTGWARGEPPPRSGNSLEVLVDGKTALSAMTDEIRAARSYVHAAGWHFDPDFLLTRGAGAATVREVLADAAARVPVRVLAWGGAPVPVFRPSRADARRARLRLVEGTEIRCFLDTHERPMHCHHEKTIVIDGRTAFVGGIDMTSLAGDRWDTTMHAPKPSVGWHDAAARIRGPAVKDLADHFRMRWREVTGQELPPSLSPEPAGNLQVQIVRTVPEGMYGAGPSGDFRILESYMAAFRSASRLIYIENQFLWSPEIVAVLADRLREGGDDFRLLVVLPARPDSGADDTRGRLATLIEADAGRGRLLACALRTHGGRLPTQQIYVHAKIAVVDDRWLTVGSANLNEHSLFNDSEVNLVAVDEALARDIRERLWAEHLEVPRAVVSGDPRQVFDSLWRPMVEEQAARAARGLRPTRRVIGLEGLSLKSELVLGPLQGLVVDG